MFDSSDILIATLRQIIRAIDLHSKYLTKKYGLTGPQLLVLQEFYRNKELSPSMVAQNVSLSQATVTTILDRLEKQEFLKRRRSEHDKRKVSVELQEKALKILNEQPSLLQDQFTSRFNKLEPWEQTQLISSLQRISSMMNAEDIDSQPVLTSGPISATAEDVQEFL